MGVCVFVCVWCVSVWSDGCVCLWGVWCVCVCDPAHCHSQHVFPQCSTSYCVLLPLRPCTTTPVRPSCDGAAFIRTIVQRCKPLYTALTKLYTLRNRLVIDHLCGPFGSHYVLHSWKIESPTLRVQWGEVSRISGTRDV